jgi:hypothetical protein
MRKHKIITVDTEGRDKGKSFLIVEKSAFEAERWATKALLALGRSGVDVPEEIMQAGALGFVLVGVEAFKKMRFEDAEGLLDEMLTCASFVPDPGKTDTATGRPIARPLRMDPDNGDIEEVTTLLKLRGEVIELHMGFSPAAALSDLAAVAISSRQNTPTSPAPSEPLSQPVGQA